MTDAQRFMTVSLALILWPACTGSADTPDAGSSDDAGADVAQDTADDSPFHGTMQCGNVPVASPACAACADERCCEQGNACADHPDCLALRECRRGCAAQDDACQSACEASHLQGAAYDGALTSCRMHECAEECFGSAQVPCGFSVGPASCQACAESACCDIGYAAHLEPAFWAYQACLVACSDETCRSACASEHEQGSLYYATWLGCLGTDCAAECGISPPYTCGGYYTGACGACVAASCCNESTACYRDAGCVGVELCARKCAGDQACLDACKTSGPADGLWESLRACLASACATDCEP